MVRIYTIPEIKAHFIGEPYVDCPEFIGHLVRNKILVRIAMNQYTYDLTKLNRETIDKINLIIKFKIYKLK